MTVETAFMPVSLSETLQPPILGRLVEYAAKERLSHGEVIARAVTEFFSDERFSPPPPLAFAQPAVPVIEPEPESEPETDAEEVAA